MWPASRHQYGSSTEPHAGYAKGFGGHVQLSDIEATGAKQAGSHSSEVNLTADAGLDEGRENSIK